MKNEKWVLKQRPNGRPNIETDFEKTSEDLPEINFGEILIETEYLSLDPYMRGRMNAGPSYASAVEIGDVMEGEVIAKVIKSKSKSFNIGDMVNSKIGWQKYKILSENELKSGIINKINISKEMPITYSLGVLGMPGRTAHLGFFEVLKPKPGQTLVVSAASGAVGSLVGQLGKISGCTVIGIVGSDIKLDYCINELGFDYCFNYKTQNIDSELGKLGQDYVNMYFDNVGGEISDAVMNHLAVFSRTAVCGQIADYNAKTPPLGPRVARTMLTKQSTMQGFIVFNFEHKYQEAMDDMTKWIKEGKIKYKEDINIGFDNIPLNFMKLFDSENFGKLLVDIKS